MPRKPLQSCKYQGCPRLCKGTYCDEHKQTENKRYNKYQRPQYSKESYGKAWSRISKAYREQHPLCELCLTNNRYTPAVLVHHKRAIKDGGTHESDNLMSLCQECHSRLHAEQGDRWG